MEDWKEYKLGEAISFKNGKKRNNTEGCFPIYGGNGILGYSNETNYENCVIIGRVGAYCGSVFYEKSSCWVSDNAISAIPKEGFDTQFCYYLLSQLQLNKRCVGTGQPLLTQEILNRITVILPPLPTQQKIAQILSSLDDKIELNNKINANLEQQAQALFKSWFVDSQEKNGTIGDYCNVKSGFAFKSSWWQDSGLKVVRIGDIEQGKLSLDYCAHVPNDKHEIAKDFILKGGDLVIAMTGATIGKFSMVPKTDEVIFANQRVGKFFLGENPIERVPFLYCTLCNEEVITEFINRGQGSAQPNISTGDILSIPCWIPESSEIERFNKTVQPLFETIISNQNENRKLTTLRDTLLPKLMNREITNE